MHKLPPPTVDKSQLYYIGYINGHDIYLDTNSDNNCKYICHSNNLWYRSPRITDLLDLPTDNTKSDIHRLRCLIAATRTMLSTCHLSSNDIHKALLHLLNALQNEARR